MSENILKDVIDELINQKIVKRYELFEVGNYREKAEQLLNDYALKLKPRIPPELKEVWNNHVRNNTIKGFIYDSTSEYCNNYLKTTSKEEVEKQEAEVNQEEFNMIMKDCVVLEYTKSVDDLPSNIDGTVKILHTPTGVTVSLRMPKKERGRYNMSERMRNVVKLIESEIKNCRYNYFDLLELAVGQVSGDHLRGHLASINAQVDTDEGTLVEAARIVCKPTLEATDKLLDRIRNGEYLDTDDVYEEID